MSLNMNLEVFVTCAVTGSRSTQDRRLHVPRSPVQIAARASVAANAGVAIVHCHVHDSETGMSVIGPQAVREKRGLTKRAPVAA